MFRHYLDHASTAPPRPEVVDAMRGLLDAPVGDPGRVHLEGRNARAVVESAREAVADLLEVRPRQVIFTSSGTEAINAATWGAARSAPGAPILCAAVEHSAVRAASARMAPVEPIAVDSSGRIDPNAVAARLAQSEARPALVQCQWANHEVGTVQPVAEIAAACREAGVLLHVDAAAACGHTDLRIHEIGPDLVSVSAHKFGGPPGAGALILRPGLRIEPFIVGGSQERARRAGFENVLAIAGFGAAAAALAADGHKRVHLEEATARRQIATLLDGALSIPGVSLVGDPDPAGRLPHLVCLGVAGVEAEAIVIGLDRAGVAVHSGSACSSESLEPSPVLEAMGVDASHSLRLSVGWSTTQEDIDVVIHELSTVIADLQALAT